MGKLFSDIETALDEITCFLGKGTKWRSFREKTRDKFPTTITEPLLPFLKQPHSDFSTQKHVSWLREPLPVSLLQS